MLSEREQQTLRLIEQQLAEEDGRFAAAMSRPLTDGRCRWTRRCYDLVIGLAVTLALICFLLAGNGTAGAGAVAALFAAAASYDRWRRFRPPHARRIRQRRQHDDDAWSW